MKIWKIVFSYQKQDNNNISTSYSQHTLHKKKKKYSTNQLSGVLCHIVGYAVFFKVWIFYVNHICQNNHNIMFFIMYRADLISS